MSEKKKESRLRKALKAKAVEVQTDPEALKKIREKIKKKGQK